MPLVAVRHNLVTARCRATLIVAGVLALFSAAPQAQAQEDSARKILKAMSDYVASQKVISAKFDSDIEVVTHNLQKIQFTSSGEIVLSRPDKLRAHRTGGYADVEFVYDGKTFVVHSRDHKAFAQGPAPATIDQLIGRLRSEYAVEAPGADLLSSKVYDELMSGVVEAKHVGLGVIDGVECEHLAFRNEETDWQIWIEAGARPIPRKYIITSKAVTGAPQYTLRIKEWRSGGEVAADAFAFKAPADAKTVEFTELADIDEVPAGVALGASQ